jgi:hypothetical protein
MSEVKVNKLSPRSGTTVTIGDSGDTTNIVGTLQNNGAVLTGDISSVVAGAGMTGGGTSGDVTLNVIAGTGIDVSADAVAVDVSDFLTNGANNRIVTATGTDAMNGEANLTFDGSTLHVLSTATTNQVKIENTDGGAASAPDLVLFRNSASPADNDALGRIHFRGKTDTGAENNYAYMYGTAADVSNGSEDGNLFIGGLIAGADRSWLTLKEYEVAVNDDSNDMDFRVESDDSTHGLFLEGSSGNTFIGTSSSSIGNVGVKMFGTDDSTNKSGVNIVTAGGNVPCSLNRSGGNGDLMSFRSETTQEGTISVSGTTVSYNGFTGTHWSRFIDNSTPTILRGTVLET